MPPSREADRSRVSLGSHRPTVILTLPCLVEKKRTKVRSLAVLFSAADSRYGYKDVRKEDHNAFEQLLIESLEKYLRKEARELALEFAVSDMDLENETVVSSSREAPSGVGELQIPLMADQRAGEFVIVPSESSPETSNGAELPPASMPSSDEDPALEYELSALREAMDSGVTYLLAHGDVRARKDSLFIKKLVINYFYAFLRNNCRAGAANLSVPHMNIMEAGMTYMV